MSDNSGKQSARLTLNSLLHEAVLSLKQSCEHADAFHTVVQVCKITDYLSFVEPNDATVCLEQILSRTNCCFYSSSQQFRGDFELMLANALAYNCHGKHAFKPIIKWAQELLEACCKELECRHKELLDAEIKLKVASGGCQGRAESPHKQESSTSSLEALAAACELAAEQDGLHRTDPDQTDVKLHLSSGAPCMPVPFPAMFFRGVGQEGDYRTGMNPMHMPLPTIKGRVGAAVLDTASKYRRHKSKVFIRPNKVVYLPTTFMEENFHAMCLPVNCKMIVETNGEVQPDHHTVTIKSVPRQGLSTMYCMTNVLKFQQQYLNWQILNWTRVDEAYIKIHLQGPSGSAQECMKTEPVECASPRKTGLDTKKRHRGRRSRAGALEDVAEAEGEEAAVAGFQAGHAGSQAANGSLALCSTGGMSQVTRTAEQVHLHQLRNGSSSSSPSHQGSLQQPPDDLNPTEGHLSPSNSSGISNRLDKHPSLHPSGLFSQQQLHQQQPQPQLQQQLQMLQYQQQLSNSSQVQFGGVGGFPIQMPLWGLPGNGSSEKAVMHPYPGFDLRLQGVAASNRSSSLPLLPNIPPEVAMQPHEAMMLINQLVASGAMGSEPAMYGGLPASLMTVGASPLLDASGCGKEAPAKSLSGVKRFKLDLGGVASPRKLPQGGQPGSASDCMVDAASAAAFAAFLVAGIKLPFEQL